MPRFHIPFGHSEKAGQTRLGRKQIIAVGVQPVGSDIEPDGKQFLVRLQQKAEIHFDRQRPGKCLDLGKQDGVGGP